MSTQGSPAKFSYAITERRTAVAVPARRLGFKPDQSVVTVFGGEGPHNVNDHVSTTAAGILNNVADVATASAPMSAGTCRRASSWSCSGPEHAATIAADGLHRADVQRFVFEHARISLGRLSWAACGACTTGRPGWEDHDERSAAPGAAVDDIYRDGGGRLGQALLRGAQLHVQPRGEPRLDRSKVRGGPPSSRRARPQGAVGPPARNGGRSSAGRSWTRVLEAADPRRVELIGRPYPGFSAMKN